MTIDEQTILNEIRELAATVKAQQKQINAMASMIAKDSTLAMSMGEHMIMRTAGLLAGLGVVSPEASAIASWSDPVRTADALVSAGLVGPPVHAIEADDLAKVVERMKRQHAKTGGDRLVNCAVDNPCTSGRETATSAPKDAPGPGETAPDPSAQAPTTVGNRHADDRKPDPFDSF